jgi:hypothetical protein
VVKALYPNPFADKLHLWVACLRPMDGHCVIYNVGGEIVGAVDKKLAAGSNEMVWDGRNSGGFRAASGAYILHVVGSDDAGFAGDAWAEAAILR